MREYRQKPEVKEHMREYERKRGQTPQSRKHGRRENRHAGIIRPIGKNQRLRKITGYI